MRVKVHPHRTMVQSGIEACVSITPMKKHGRAYYMGTAMLRDASFVIHESGVKRAQDEQVRNVHAWATGELAFESPMQIPLTVQHMVKVTYHFNIGRFMTVHKNPNRVIDVTDGHFKAAYFCGRDFYVSLDAPVV